MSRRRKAGAHARTPRADKQSPGTDREYPSPSSNQGIAEAAVREVDPRLGPFVASLAELLIADLLRVAPQKR